ncbi:peroxiredoxin-like family protein [Limibacter armeniacum]|uniref:peroxiredoxin-like family protein n=1 Tax=Limibacter armeniacum TaxID=466084 RepID=UPI002FE5C150
MKTSFTSVSFSERLLLTAEKLAKTSNPDDLAKYKAIADTLSASDLTNFALQTGDVMPSFALQDVEGKHQKISQIHNRKWLVINIFRGSWCPFCNIELVEYEKHYEKFSTLDAKVIAISPQKIEYNQSLVNQRKLKVELYSDPNCKVAERFRIGYTVPNYLNNIYHNQNVHLEKFNGEGTLKLPIPATYLIDRSGIIRMHFLSLSPYQRLDPSLVIDTIQSLIDSNDK